MLKGSGIKPRPTKRHEEKGKTPSKESLQKTLEEYKEEAVPFDEVMRTLVKAEPQHVKKK